MHRKNYLDMCRQQSVCQHRKSSQASFRASTQMCRHIQPPTMTFTHRSFSQLNKQIYFLTYYFNLSHSEDVFLRSRTPARARSITKETTTAAHRAHWKPSWQLKSTAIPPLCRPRSARNAVPLLSRVFISPCPAKP